MKNYFAILSVLLLCICCTEQMPTEKDGHLVLKTIVVDQSDIVPYNSSLGYAPVPNAEITLISGSYYETTSAAKKYTAYSDSSGLAVFDGLAASKYTMSVEKEYFLNNTGIMLRGNKLVELYASNSTPDTLKTILSVASKLVINEIYYCGPVNNAFYFYDQYVELYNTSQDTVYLDGMIVCRARQAEHPEMETIDFVQGVYLFQFPGEPLTGREYPVIPGQFVVLAQDALDHSKYITNAVDLSGADWEFFDPYGADINNPAPNINNILPDRTSDFMINVSHNAVILTDGSDWYYGDSYENSDKQYIHIPISTVIDAVEYSSSDESTKEVTTRLDAGFAGIGTLKYSGKSTERRLPGFDTNNSTLDFVLNNTPTPGYQHE
ncbi:MAG: DUF4876 domain-containing protein [Calditrichaceae bacterium]